MIWSRLLMVDLAKIGGCSRNCSFVYHCLSCQRSCVKNLLISTGWFFKRAVNCLPFPNLFCICVIKCYTERPDQDQVTVLLRYVFTVLLGSCILTLKIPWFTETAPKLPFIFIDKKPWLNFFSFKLTPKAQFDHIVPWEVLVRILLGSIIFVSFWNFFYSFY